ncbi:MAG: HlyD family efflux transporter periplasmic adaptor subunit, partial [Holophagales bacterium]|nr:HlyD family efflux transporter periplasmic adaptor subunit [Holophagales bacterium]
ADRTAVWCFDPATDTLWRPADSDAVGEARRESAAAGLVGFVQRTGGTLSVERLGGDSRFDPDIDNDGGSVDERLLAVAVADSPEDVAAGMQAPLGVVAAVRAGGDPPFGEAENALVERAAPRLRPLLGRFRQAAEAEAGGGTLRSETVEVFRAEALEHYSRDGAEHGHVLEISPAWMHRSIWMLLAAVVAALIYSLVGTVDEYASGVAVVRAEAGHSLTAPVGGTVSSVDVEPAQSVQAGQVLVRLYGAQESAELARIRRELELSLLERLRSPTDPMSERTLAALRGQLQMAEARLGERTVRAPAPGRVGDVRVSVGQLLSPGEVVLTLGAGQEAPLRVVALIPGQFRPLLKVGMPLRLELRGYPHAYQRLKVDAVSEEVFGPSEARRVLGPEIADALTVSGPVALVEANLPGPTFDSQGRSYTYHDGIPGRAEIRVRSEPILVSLIPALRAVTERTREAFDG